MSPSPDIVPPKTTILDREITPAFVAAKFGVGLETLQHLIGNNTWPSLRYRVIQGAERDEIIRLILERVDSPGLRVVGTDDKSVWERGWGEILDQVKAKEFDPVLLRPQYFDHHRVMRLDGDYIDAGDANFVYRYDNLLRRIVLAQYLQGANKVVELGCGTGTSQLILSELWPDAEFIAADWAVPSQAIIGALARHVKRSIRPVRFNMLTLDGWDDLDIDANTAVVSVHALEQLGDQWAPLLERLLEAKPQCCLHLEPILEHYDNSTLFDFLAIKYHRRRNYLHGWLGRLRELARHRRVEITEDRRLGFGDRYHEAYSVVKWRPL